MKRALTLALLLAACSDEETGPGDNPPASDYPQKLSEWGFFLGNGATQEPAPGVVPYHVISTLFADHAHKHRFIYVPEGGKIEYTDEGPWQFPEGAVLIKTFSYELNGRETLLETRLLIKEGDHYTAHTYVWNEEQTEATYQRAGSRVPVTFTDPDGQEQSIVYRVPNQNQCFGCHGDPGETELLGPKTLQMDTDYEYDGASQNQLAHLQELGLFSTEPPATRARFVDPFGDAPVEQRARSYLDANCAHCHHPGGAAGPSGLYLGWDVTDPVSLGICKSPVSAGEGAGGLRYAIVPGRPEESILVFRMRSTEPNIKMPELPTQLSDTHGTDLVAAWIAAMPVQSCGTPE